MPKKKKSFIGISTKYRCFFFFLLITFFEHRIYFEILFFQPIWIFDVFRTSFLEDFNSPPLNFALGTFRGTASGMAVGGERKSVIGEKKKTFAVTRRSLIDEANYFMSR